MVVFVTEYADFAVTAGANGSFSIPVQPGGSSTIVYPPTGGPLTGTFNGQQTTHLTTYLNPINAVGTPTSPDQSSFVGSQGILATAGHVNDPAYANGLSFGLANGTEVHIYVSDNGSGIYSLLYQTSAGTSGSISLSYSTETFYSGCFLRGSLIATGRGEICVEELVEGDLVLTHAGLLKPARWVGRSVLRPYRRPEPRDVLPVCIRAHAFAAGVPSRDLRVSPGHALLVGDVLINAGELVNGGTIVQEAAEVVHYYHVELDSHDILIADGMPCESYLDDGNRASFIGGADHIRLHGRIDRASEETCRPLVKSGPLLIEARQRLLARAIELGWQIGEQPELRIMAGDRMIEPVAVAGDRYWFSIPVETQGALRLRSAAATVDRIDPSLADNRQLGVAVGELRVDGAAVALTSDTFGSGFYPAEDDGHAAWRWMDGDGALSFDVKPAMIEVRLQIVMPVLHRLEDAARAIATA